MTSPVRIPGRESAAALGWTAADSGGLATGAYGASVSVPGRTPPTRPDSRDRSVRRFSGGGGRRRPSRTVEGSWADRHDGSPASGETWRRTTLAESRRRLSLAEYANTDLSPLPRDRFVKAGHTSNPFVRFGPSDLDRRDRPYHHSETTTTT